MAESSKPKAIWQQFQALPPARQGILAATTLASLLFCTWLASGLSATSYRLLFGGLDSGEAASVIEGLSAEGIDYRFEEGGTAIHVPASQVHEARIRLASRGLPNGSGAGFELFDKASFGATDFVQRVNYRRALQGELARAIEQLEAVDGARVQIAMPEPSPFVGERERRPSASVVLRLRPGRELESNRVQGVVHLVAAAVEGLERERVSVVDDRGRLLAPSGDAELGSAAPSSMQAFQQKLENDLANRVEAILGRTVGVGHVVARVRAELDWTKSESTEERYDPNSQIERSEQRSTETESEGGGALGGGSPGVAANVPGEGGGARGGQGQNATRNTETINYELSKTVRHSVDPLGRVQRLTLAVLVDGKRDEDGEFVPWDAAELEQFKDLAEHAVGFSEERGDQMTVINAPFQTPELEEAAAGGFSIDPGLLQLVQQGLRVAGLLIALFLFAKLVVKPLAGAAASVGDSVVPEKLRVLEERLVASGAIRDEHGGLDLAALAPAPAAPGEQVAPLAAQRSDQSINAIRGWLREG